MFIIVVLIIVSLMIAAIFLVSFIWAVRSDQYEDTYTPALRILNEENTIINNKKG